MSPSPATLDLALLAAFYLRTIMAADDTASTSTRPPRFDGSNAGYRPWLILFAAYLSLRYPDLIGVFDGTDTDPGPGQADLHAAWVRRNRQLYGAIIQAIPPWLATSLYLASPNDGAGALTRLLQDFGARTT